MAELKDTMNGILEYIKENKIMKRKSSLTNLVKIRQSGGAIIQRAKTPKAKSKIKLDPYRTISGKGYYNAWNVLKSLPEPSTLHLKGYNVGRKFTKKQKIEAVKQYMDAANKIFEHNTKLSKINMNTKEGLAAVQESFNFKHYYDKVYKYKGKNLERLKVNELNRLISEVIDFIDSPRSSEKHILTTLKNYSKIEDMVEEAMKQLPPELIKGKESLVRGMLFNLIKAAKGKGWEYYQQIINDFISEFQANSGMTENEFTKYVERQLNNQTTTIRPDFNENKLALSDMEMQDRAKLFKKIQQKRMK